MDIKVFDEMTKTAGQKGQSSYVYNQNKKEREYIVTIKKKKNGEKIE